MLDEFSMLNNFACNSAHPHSSLTHSQAQLVLKKYINIWGLI